MHFFLILCCIFLTIYSCVSWLLPTLLSWLFKRKYHINLKIGRIAVPKLILKDVTLSKDGYIIHINEVSFKSSFFNSDINKLVSVIINNVHITNVNEERRSVVVQTILKPLLSKQNSASSRKDMLYREQSYEDFERELERYAESQLLDYREKKLPPSLIMFAQFMGIHIFNATVSIHDSAENSTWSIEGSAAELHADGAAGGPTKALVFSANLVDVKVKVVAEESIIGEASCNLLIEGTVKAEGPLNVEKIHTTISNPTILIQDELLIFMKKHKRKRKSHVKPCYDDTEDSINSIIPRLSPVIPKIFSLKIDTTIVSFVENKTKSMFQFSLHSLQINSRFSGTSMVILDTGIEKTSLPQVYVAFQMDQLQLSVDKEQYVFVNKIKLDAKLEKGVLNLYLILSVLTLHYDHVKYISKYEAISHRMKKSRPLEIQTRDVEKDEVPLWVRRLSSWCIIQGCAEIRTGTLKTSLPHSSLAFGVAGVKLKLDQHKDREGVLVGSGWVGSAELLVDGGWVGVDTGVGGGPSRRTHRWGAGAVGVALVKWANTARTLRKIEAMIDCIRLEWSPKLANSILELHDCINQYKSSTKKTNQSETSSQAPQRDISINVALSHINLFLVVNEAMCLMTRIDAISLESNTCKSGVMVSGLKVIDVVPYKDPTPCQRSDEIPLSLFHVKLARVDIITSKETNTRLLDIQFFELTELEWSPDFHLKVLHFVRNVNSFREKIKQRDSYMEVDRGKKMAIDWRVSFKNETNLVLLLSKENNMLFATDDMTISSARPSGLSLCWSQLKLILNGDEIANVDGFTMERLADDHDIRVERKANEGFVLEWNKVWGISIESIRVVFPYKHRFADAVQGDFVSLFKWIKQIHDIKKKPFNVDSPLPSDLHIKVEEILIEMNDDPFEVKLRDNYELLEDEYKESQKRRSMLDAKVQELCKPHLFLPAGKIEELYAALRQKDAQIYVQRCRAAPTPRRRLFACVLTQLRLVALADTSMHGTQNATNILRDIDHDTPWPEEGVEFSSIWCRAVSVQVEEWQLLLRDFPQPLVKVTLLKLWGTLLGAEEAPPSKSIRTEMIDQGPLWGEYEIERSMMPLKWYYDICCEMSHFSYAFGPCWEPVIAQCNLAFDQVSRPSLDPSQPLAWWDKIRLLMHGRLTAKIDKFTCLLHVSLDPYNTTEEMEVSWTDLALDWTNGKIRFLGSLVVLVRTASKYDDCRVVRVGRVRLWVRVGWGGDTDHRHPPTAPHKVPEYSSNQEHDSYRAFRSQGLDLHITMDTMNTDKNTDDGPVLLLYGSTLRWFESLKIILSGITRPTRRGRVFNNVRPRKPQLSRHYKSVSVSLTLHNLQVYYWSSSSMQRGIEMLGKRVTCASKHCLSLVPCNEGLIRRPRANWTTDYMNCDLNDVEIWLKTAAPPSADDVRDNDSIFGVSVGEMEKCYCLSVSRVSYGRQGVEGGHQVAVHDLRGAWTKLNRDLAFALIDTYIKTQQLKKNLSTKALKDEEKPNTSPRHQRDADVVSPPPSTSTQSSCGGDMLAALVLEAGSEAPVVLSDELTGPEGEYTHTAHTHTHSHLRGGHLDDDHAHTHILIELVNSQVVLKGTESGGYVVVCAARAEVRQRVKRDFVSWSGALSAMQYYATLSAGLHNKDDENIQWVSVFEIEDRSRERGSSLDVPRLMGSGHSAGGVIGDCVGPSNDPANTQLQRIVSRCACEFFYVSSEQTGEDETGHNRHQTPYDSFTLMHHDLDVCTNSLQYAMLLDVVNNVVLHVEPERRRTLERRARMRFQMQLHRDHDPRQLIHKLQTQVRESLAKLRRLEKEYYLKNRSITTHDPVAIEELKALDNQVNECKESVWSLGEELDAMVRAVRELSAGRGRQISRGGEVAPHRYNEICFQSARWRLTDKDGQLGIADLLLTNFLYTNTSRSDDSVEHQLEVGYVQVTNLLPNEPFPEVLVPYAASGKAPLCRRSALRVFCRDRPPVGGIAVKEHFEINIVPFKIGLTKKFFNTMLKFCFPERDPDIEAIEGDDEEGTLKASSSTATLVSTGSKKIKKKKDSNSNFYVKRDKDKDDVEKMKERAEKNKLFIYIKIPEVPVRVSYKGSKEKNLEDVRDLPLVLPTLEYHNVTWTWLDLLLATKTDTRRVILSQAIRQKLQLNRRAATAPEPHEEDKARLLLGERTVAENKPQKKNTPGVFKFSKS